MPSKAQVTPLPTVGAFIKFETSMQNRLPSSTLKVVSERRKWTIECSWTLVMTQLANAIEIGKKHLVFQKIKYLANFAVQHLVSNFCIFEESVDAETSGCASWESTCLLQSTLLPWCWRKRRTEPPNDFERAASLKRHNQLAFKYDMLHTRWKWSNNGMLMGGLRNYGTELLPYYEHFAGNFLPDPPLGCRGH